MRKFSAIFAVLALCAALLSGCIEMLGSSPSDNQSAGVTEDGRTIINIAHWDASGAATEKKVLETAVAAFEKKNPQYKVNITIYSDYENQFVNIMNTSPRPDVFLVPDGDFGKWFFSDGAYSDLFTDLTQLVERSNLIDTDSMCEGLMERYMFNKETQLTGSGNVYALPKDVGPYVMYYNKDLFDQLGVEYPSADAPMNIYDAIEMWQKFGKTNDRGVQTRFGVAGVQIEGLVWSNGAEYLSDDRRTVTIASEEGIEAYQMYADLITKYKVVPSSAISTGTNTTAMFINGTVACLIDGRYTTTTLRRDAEFDWDIAPVPSFSADSLVNGWSGSVGYAVYNYSGVKDGAWKLVEFIASYEGQMAMAKTGFSIPIYTDEDTIAAFYAVENGKKPSNTKVYLEAAANQRENTYCYLPGTRWRTFLDTQSSVLMHDDESRRKTAAEMLPGWQIIMQDYIKSDFKWLF
ncbi:MAG: ABC transporter substrate-binding protein [Christensenellales bacterium]